MNLPVIDVPIFTTTLPSNKKEVKFRQFTVKEEKILLIAEQSKEVEDIVAAIKQIVQNCLLTQIDINSLPIFDIEWLFLQLRMKSVGEIIEFRIEDYEDKKIYDLELDLQDVKLEVPESNNIFPLGKNLHVKIRYPSMKEFDSFLKFDQNNPQHTISIVASLIDSIYDDESVYDPKNVSKEELEAYVETFPKSTMNDIESFFEHIPRLTHQLKYQNSFGNERIFNLRGLQDFFL